MQRARPHPFKAALKDVGRWAAKRPSGAMRGLPIPTLAGDSVKLPGTHTQRDRCALEMPGRGTTERRCVSQDSSENVPCEAALPVWIAYGVLLLVACCGVSPGLARPPMNHLGEGWILDATGSTKQNNKDLREAPVRLWMHLAGTPASMSFLHQQSSPGEPCACPGKHENRPVK